MALRCGSSQGDSYEEKRREAQDAARNSSVRRLLLVCIAGLLLLQLAPAGDVLVVLVEGLGEDVAAAAVGDEIEVLAGDRVQYGLERGLARIGDRARRQAGVRIGIVGARRLQVGVAQRAVQRPRSRG